jgi:hypothetical protein
MDLHTDRAEPPESSLLLGDLADSGVFGRHG